MIKENLINGRLLCDKRGTITTGMKVMGKGGKEYPKAVDHFVVDKYMEIAGMYGDKPKELFVYMPSDNLLDFFDCNFGLYRSDRQKVRNCDGETCRHILDETIECKPAEGESQLRVKSFKQGQITPCVCLYMPETMPDGKGGEKRNPKLCGYSMYLKLYVANPFTLKIMTVSPIQFRTGSKNSGDTIYTELKKYPYYKNIPFKLSVEMKRVGEKNFPIWTLQPYIEPSDVLKLAMKNVPDERAGEFKALPAWDSGTDSSSNNKEQKPNTTKPAEKPKPQAQTQTQTQAQVPPDSFNENGNFEVGGRGPEPDDYHAAAMERTLGGDIEDAEFTEVKEDIAKEPAGDEVSPELADEVKKIKFNLAKSTTLKILNETWIGYSDRVKLMPGVQRDEIMACWKAKKQNLNLKK